MNNDTYRVVDDYIARLFAPQDDVLAGIEHTLEKASIRNLSVTPTQGKLLHLLAFLARAERILEIGTLGGYSTIWLARALPATGKLVSIDRDAEHAEVARGNIERAGLAERVELRVGEALDVLAQLEAERTVPFDMIFIDADKPPYPDYLKFALRLSHEGTLIVADNVVRGGRVAEADGADAGLAAIRNFNQALADDPNLTATILQTVGGKGHDGMAIAVVGAR